MGKNWHSVWLFCAGLSGLIATILAALAAHALPGRLAPGPMQMVRDTISFQGWTTAALLAAGLLAKTGNRRADLAGACFTVGLLLFCGDVYALALGDIHLSLVAPTGGFTLMAGWLCLAAAALRA
jgi:uncharacterized membrane protein YgdD (TMEM256/DUF423 family)